MYTVSVSTRFVADHSLRLNHGQSEPVHRHTWQVCASFAGTRLDDTGLLVDFNVARERLEQIASALAGTFLNEWAALGGRNPSAEHVAEAIFGQLSTAPELAATLCRISITEAPGCEAAYLGKGSPLESCWTPTIDDKAVME
jgi:6-pyruvoyltetrahydropterin/6-carboxytetrahydropterin synthase